MAIQNRSVHHFVDDKKLLYTINSLNVVNKHINYDLKQLSNSYEVIRNP